MARIRSIKPEFWTDSKVVGLPLASRLLFIGSWNFARCDQGHLDDDAIALKLKVLPVDDVDPYDTLEAVVAAGLVDRYHADGRTFLHIRKFTQNQKIETRWNSRCPYCPLQDSSNLAETPPTTLQDWKGEDRKGEEGTRKSSSPPPEDDFGFEDFWQQTPKRNGKRLGKSKALRVWLRLSKSQRESARNGVVHYRTACDQGLTIAKDIFRWLRDREFEDWQEPAVAPAKPGEPRSVIAGWGEQQREPDPACEHADPMCIDCRRANVARLKEMAEGIGAMA